MAEGHELENLKEVVCKVNLSDFLERKEKRERAAHLKEQMDERVKILQKNAIYEMLAKEDPELSKLLDEFKEINK